MDLNKTVCALATPPGRAALPWCACRGPQAYTVTAQVFQPLHAEKRVQDARGYTALLGHYRLRGQEMDETIALFFRAPHQLYRRGCRGAFGTRRRRHGRGSAGKRCTWPGAPRPAPGEFTRRAVLNGRMDLTQAEAVMEIIAASGRQGAALAKTALDGALAKTMRASTAACRP